MGNAYIRPEAYAYTDHYQQQCKKLEYATKENKNSHRPCWSKKDLKGNMNFKI